MHREMVRCAAFVVVAAALPAQEAREAKSKPPKPPAEVRDALAEAERENRRVLLLCATPDFEPNEAFQKLWGVRELRRLLQYEYVRGELDPLHAWAERLLGGKPQELPILAVLDAKGKLLGKRPVPSFVAKADVERGGKPAYDAKALGAWLTGYKPKPRDARVVLAGAQALAKKTKRRLFVHLGAPWWGWCGRLEKFLGQKKVRALLDKDYVLVKIDQDRMSEGKKLAEELRASHGKSRGIPWIVILDASGAELATSDGPKGNVGCPVAPHEREHFMKMLEGSAQRLGEKELAELAKALETYAKKLRN